MRRLEAGEQNQRELDTERRLLGGRSRDLNRRVVLRRKRLGRGSAKRGGGLP